MSVCLFPSETPIQMPVLCCAVLWCRLLTVVIVLRLRPYRDGPFIDSVGCVISYPERMPAVVGRSVKASAFLDLKPPSDSLF